MADPTALYSYQGQAPAPLPEKILLSDGRKRTDVSSFTVKEIKDAGFTGPYEVPVFNQEYQRISWNSETLSFDLTDVSDEELWDRVRKERNRLLLESDWTMAADAPQTLNFHEYEMYRQRLRDITQSVEDPKNVIWPESPEGKSDDEFDQPRIHESRILWRVRDIEDILKEIQSSVLALSRQIRQPFPSWTWNANNLKWEAPVDPPSDYDGENYGWVEELRQWKSEPLEES